MPLEDPRGLFAAVENKRFGKSTCFLCGRRLGSRNRSDEHVVPKWVQNRFKLWNRHLVLLNGTSIPYRQLTIPCCKTCNNEHLSRLEERVRAAVLAGPSAVQALDQETLFLWLGKIFYGLLLKEFFLRRDRSKPSSRRIVPRSLLKRYSLHHTLLQASRIPFRFHTTVPASVLVVPVKSPPSVSAQFDFRDSYELLTISVRLGDVGLIGSLQDGAAQRTLFFPSLAKFTHTPLHPLQFVELTAKWFYMASLQNRVPKFVMLEGSEAIEVVQPPLGGFSSHPVFDPWVQRDFATTLAAFLEMPLDHVYRPDDAVRSWTIMDDGKVRELSFQEQPWPPEVTVHVEPARRRRRGGT